MLVRARQFVRDHHFSPIVRGVASACEKYLRAFHNEGFYDFDVNGERRVLAQITPYLREPIVFDVGAHTGSWTAMLLLHMPMARVDCFEIVPETCAALRHEMQTHGHVRVHPFGLSDRAGTVSMAYNKTYTSTSAITPLETSRFFAGSITERLVVPIDTGDAVVERLALDHLDVLKIDVEGHEVDVLRGFAQTFASARAPRFVQFEYGQTYLPGRHTLKEAYEVLEPNGYVIGRIFPKGVEFKGYAASDEHFRMGNYAAVKADDPIRRRLEYRP
jgi:FkbM family methyltransferase